MVYRVGQVPDWLVRRVSGALVSQASNSDDVTPPHSHPPFLLRCVSYCSSQCSWSISSFRSSHRLSCFVRQSANAGGRLIAYLIIVLAVLAVCSHVRVCWPLHVSPQIGKGERRHICYLRLLQHFPLTGNRSGLKLSYHTWVTWGDWDLHLAPPVFHAGSVPTMPIG